MNEFLQLLQSCDSIGISGHERPDGDCVGSCLGLYHYLKALWPEKKISVLLEPVPSYLYLLPGCDVIRDSLLPGEHFDGFVALDCASIERLSFARPAFEQAKVKAVIDHHISNEMSADFVRILPQAAATCEILTDLLPEPISLDVANCLYLGIVHDTGVFKHSNATRHTMECVGRLMEKGVDTAAIINQSFYQKTYLQNQMLGRALVESFLALNGKVILSVISRRVMDFYQAESADLDGVIDQLAVTEGIEAAALLHEAEPEVFKASLRSKKKVDVCRVAKCFGGGGHVRAAGFTCVGDWHDIVNKMLAEIEEQLREAK